MAGEKGMQYKKKSFTIGGEKTSSGKKCFKDDCVNEGVACERCFLIQSKFVFYQPKGADNG